MTKWKLVPVEPTEEIRSVIRNETCVYQSEDELYAAMLEAAPPAPSVPADVARDAGRYRWLREKNAELGRGFYVGDDTDKEPGDITWIGSDLDAAIDAAMSEKGGA